MRRGEIRLIDLDPARGSESDKRRPGVIMSNVMGAFSPKGINALAPGKRPASSMSPTVIVRHGRPVAAIGSPGGDTIPNTVAHVLRNLIDGHMTIDSAEAMLPEMRSCSG